MIDIIAIYFVQYEHKLLSPHTQPPTMSSPSLVIEFTALWDLELQAYENLQIQNREMTKAFHRVSPDKDENLLDPTERDDLYSIETGGRSLA